MTRWELFNERLEQDSTSWGLGFTALVLSVFGFVFSGEVRDPLIFAGFIVGALAAAVVWSTSDDYQAFFSMAAAVASVGLGAITVTDVHSGTMPGAHLGGLWIALGAAWSIIAFDLFLEQTLEDRKKRYYHPALYRWGMVVAGTGLWLVFSFAAVYRNWSMELYGVLGALSLVSAFRFLNRNKLRWRFVFWATT